MPSNIVLIAAVDAEQAARSAGPDAEDKLKAAMGATARHWMATDENEQFLGACEGAARVLDAEDRARVETSLRLLQGLAAASSGVPVDFGALLPEDPEKAPEPFPLQKWWREIKDKERGHRAE